MYIHLNDNERPKKSLKWRTIDDIRQTYVCEAKGAPMSQNFDNTSRVLHAKLKTHLQIRDSP